MSRDEFMRELEYLLQDIPDEEKADALQYYRDYFEEAGPERQDEVIREFGSPERIAAIIRSDISGNLEEGGEFTESGYQDGRFREPNYQMAHRYDLPDEVVSEYGGAQAQSPRTNKTLKIILWIILILVAAPMLLGIGGGLIGLLSGCLGVLVGLAVFLGVSTAALLIAGIVVFVVGIVTVTVHPLGGLLMIGIAVLIAGLGFLALAMSILFYGRFLPFLFRGIADLAGSLVHGRRGNAR